MRHPWRPPIPIYVIVFPAAFVIGAYGATYAPLSWLVRPLAISMIGALILLVATRLVTREWITAGFGAGLIIWLLSGFAVAMLALVWIVIARRVSPRMRRVRLPSASSLTGSLNVFASAWLAVAVSTAVLTVARPPVDLPAAITLDPIATSARPDIYLILLDGHARVDTLASLGFDNEPFLQALEARGFDVYRDAEGSYRQTGQVLGSLLNGRQLADLPINPPESVVGQRRYLMDMIDDAPLLDELRGIGYQIVTSAPNYSIGTLDSADVYLDDGEPNGFEVSLLKTTALAGILNVVAPKLPHEWHASRIRANLAHVRSVVNREGGQPVFMLAHVMSPHPPYVYDANGTILPPLACYPATCQLFDARGIDLTREQFGKRYTGQVAYLDGLVLSMLDDVLANPNAIVVVFSDHGARYSEAESDEWYRTLFAARTPGHPGAFDGAHNAVAILPVLFNAYFGAPGNIPAGGRFKEIGGRPLNVRLVGTR